MTQMVPSAPRYFNCRALGGRWFHWDEVEKCLWPGRGIRSASINETLAEARLVGGVYCLAYAKRAPRICGPTAHQVLYVGETSCFERRLAQFARSAGLWGPRRNGHSAGWRWKLGPEHLWIALFPIEASDQAHVTAGMRRWMEGVALEQHRRARGSIPSINAGVDDEAGA